MHTATLAVWVIDAPCSVVEEACRLSVALQVHSEERRGLDRRIKDLEIRLSGALSSKSLSDEEHAQRAQVCPAAQLPPMPAGWSAGPKFIMRADKAAQLWRRAGTIAAVPASAVPIVLMWQAPCVQELQQQAASASKAQHAAEADLARVKSKGADIQRKVLAAQQPLMVDTVVICLILCMAKAERPRLSCTPGSTLSAIAGMTKTHHIPLSS